MANGNINWMGNRVVDRGNNDLPRSQMPMMNDQGMACPNMDQTPMRLPDIPDDDMMSRSGPPPVMEKGYVPAYLISNIGKFVRAEFVIGNAYLDKAGRLIEVGVNYFVLEEIGSRTLIMCDLYSVKFVNILNV